PTPTVVATLSLHDALPILGTEPATFGAERELFRRGSSVELWDLKTKQRVWVCMHPGAWLGAVYGDAPQGVSVQFIKPGSPAEKADRKSTRLNSSHGSISYA